nr:hypothetical protein [Tanacetum cinerariifolium]
MEECHQLLTDQVDLVNPEDHRLVPDLSKLLPLGGDTTRKVSLSISKLKAANYLDFGLEELVLSLWIESERDYNISATCRITHWWFKRKNFYITRHNAPSDRHALRSHMRILSVISINTFERYGYAFLKEIVIRRADYNEYKISKADFKNLHPNDFEDLYLLHLQGKLNYLPGSDKVHLYNAINLWIRNIVIRQYYTIISKPRVVIYRDRNDQKKMMRENEVHKFSDGTLTRVLHKLDHMVKDFRLTSIIWAWSIKSAATAGHPAATTSPDPTPSPRRTPSLPPSTSHDNTTSNPIHRSTIFLSSPPPSSAFISLTPAAMPPPYLLYHSGLATSSPTIPPHPPPCHFLTTSRQHHHRQKGVFVYVVNTTYGCVWLFNTERVRLGFGSAPLGCVGFIAAAGL